ncbi:unnamed protein product [Cladocopium goreaui]|uniref:Ribonuclease H (RNase H) n=1 Tax=Cladocopium goreaui TaxID=2562237 RepID=A0A9P1BSM2_9DINO|nr:unnamed protein product [Cladocopium goreaui]
MTQDREALRKLTFQNHKLQVMMDTKSLGVHLCSSKVRSVSHHAVRMHQAITMASKVASFPLPANDRGLICATKILPKVLFGTEVCPPVKADFGKLRSAIARAVWKKRSCRSTDVSISWLSHSRSFFQHQVRQALREKNLSIANKRLDLRGIRNLRAELRAVLAALIIENRPLHVRSDSSYVVDGVNNLLQGATVPFDGDNVDLWRQVADLLAHRFHSFRISWVKGHASAADVESGISTNEDQAGNATADAAAELQFAKHILVAAALDDMPVGLVPALPQKVLHSDSDPIAKNPSWSTHYTPYSIDPPRSIWRPPPAPD